MDEGYEEVDREVDTFGQLNQCVHIADMAILHARDGSSKGIWES